MTPVSMLSGADKWAMREMFDAVAAYSSGTGEAPLLEGLTPAGLEFWQSEFGQSEAARWIGKRHPVRETSDGLDASQANLLLARPFQTLVDRLNRQGPRFVAQLQRHGLD